MGRCSAQQSPQSYKSQGQNATLLKLPRMWGQGRAAALQETRRPATGTTKPCGIQMLQSKPSSEVFWRNHQKCKHRCMGTDANQSHLFLPRQHECPVLGAVRGLKHKKEVSLKRGLIRQGDVSVCKVLALQVCRPEFSFQSPFKMLAMHSSTHSQSQDWGRWRQGNLWGSLAGESRLTADLQAN